ncbi:phage portal protein, partial [Staphylococcus aureus]|uniref:phage portal protein n=1 Tax=Staphylococcus aureus TaxID=1280 RepID=UPI00210B5AD6
EYMADNRVAHDYASYISDFINGYFLGNPIQCQIDDAEFYELNDTDVDEDTTSNIEDNTNRNASEMHVDAPKTQEHAVTESQVNNIDKTVDNDIELAPRHNKDDQTTLNVNSLKPTDVNDGHVVEDS